MANEEYGALPGPVIEMLRHAGRAAFDLREDDEANWGDVYTRHAHIEDARAALESLGIPLEVLAALKAGTWQAVPKDLTAAMRRAHSESYEYVPPGAEKAWDVLLAAAPATTTKES